MWHGQWSVYGYCLSSTQGNFKYLLLPWMWVFQSGRGSWLPSVKVRWYYGMRLDQWAWSATNAQCLSESRGAEKWLTTSQSCSCVSSCSTLSPDLMIPSRRRWLSLAGTVTRTRIRARWIGRLESDWSSRMHSDTCTDIINKLSWRETTWTCTWLFAVFPCLTLNPASAIAFSIIPTGYGVCVAGSTHFSATKVAISLRNEVKSCSRSFSFTWTSPFLRIWVRLSSLQPIMHESWEWKGLPRKQLYRCRMSQKLFGDRYVSQLRLWRRWWTHCWFGVHHLDWFHWRIRLCLLIFFQLGEERMELTLRSAILVLYFYSMQSTYRVSSWRSE